MDMPEYHMTTQQVEAYQAWLRPEERAKGTREKYLLEQGYAPVTVNSMLASLHSFFRFAGWTGCQVKYVNIQHRDTRIYLVTSGSEHAKVLNQLGFVQ